MSSMMRYELDEKRNKNSYWKSMSDFKMESVLPRSSSQAFVGQMDFP